MFRCLSPEVATQFFTPFALRKIAGAIRLRQLACRCLGLAHVNRSTDGFVDSIQGKSIAQQKQAAFDKLFKVVKVFGV
jgi:hypothetical protein